MKPEKGSNIKSRQNQKCDCARQKHCRPIKKTQPGRKNFQQTRHGWCVHRCSYQLVTVVTVSADNEAVFAKKHFLRDKWLHPPIINWDVKSNFPCLWRTEWPGSLNVTLGSPISAPWPWCRSSITPDASNQITWLAAQAFFQLAFALLHSVCSKINSNIAAEFNIIETDFTLLCKTLLLFFCCVIAKRVYTPVKLRQSHTGKN